MQKQLLNILSRLSANKWYYVMTEPQSGPTVLLISHTFNYMFVGGTTPTAFTPGQTSVVTGTLNSAPLRRTSPG